MSSYEHEAPSGDFSDNSYVSRQGHKGEPLNVVSDQERIEDPIDARTADSDEQLSMFGPSPFVHRPCRQLGHAPVMWGTPDTDDTSSR